MAARRSLGSVAALVALGAVGGLVAGAPPPHDPATPPETKGSWSATGRALRGEVDGLILKDGTQIHVRRTWRLSWWTPSLPGTMSRCTACAPCACPWSRRPRSPTRRMVQDRARPGGRRIGRSCRARPAQRALGGRQGAHGPLLRPRGETNGAPLEDGTFLRPPPHELSARADMLVPGRTIAASAAPASAARTVR
ncbi:MAG: hypothetical protein U1E17_04420 [Geminicoccaceae bacterium]